MTRSSASPVAERRPGDERRRHRAARRRADLPQRPAQYQRRNLSADGSNGVLHLTGAARQSTPTASTTPTCGRTATVEFRLERPERRRLRIRRRIGQRQQRLFLTRRQLVGIDTDDSVDLYDARVGRASGLQNPPPSPPPCPAVPQARRRPRRRGPPPNGTSSVNNPPEPPTTGLQLRSRKGQQARRQGAGQASKEGRQGLRQAEEEAQEEAQEGQKRAKPPPSKAADACNQG